MIYIFQLFLEVTSLDLHAGKILFWVKDYEVEEDRIPNFDNVGFIANNFDEFLHSKLY